jgi:parvulin-like peptidyl-prolyl isomerase
MEDLKNKIKNSINKIDPNLLNIIKRGNIFPDFLREYIINEVTNTIFLKKGLCDDEIKNHLITKRLKENDLKVIRLKKGLKEEDYHQQILMDLKKYIFSKTNFQDEIENYFFTKKEDLDIYTFNIIRLKDKDLAIELFIRLDEGESDFVNLAKKYAIYSDLYPKGIFGPVTLKGMNPIIKKELVNSSNGELKEPFQAGEWWIIIKLLEKKEAILNHNMKKKLLLELFDLFVQKITKEILEDYANDLF